MKGSLSTSILSYLLSRKLFQFYWLLLFSAVPLFFGSKAMVSIAASPKIAQAVTGITINRPNLNIGSQGERVSELQAALKLLGFYTGAVDGIYQDGTAKAVSQFKQAAGLKPDGIVDAATWQKLFPSEAAAIATVPSPVPAPISTPTAIRPLSVPTQSNNTDRVVNSKPEPKPATPRKAAVNSKPAPRPVTPKQATNTRPQRPPVRPTTPRITPIPISERTPGIQYTAQGWPILRLGNRGSEVVKLQTELKRLGFLTGSIDGDFGAATETAVKALQTRYGVEADGVAGGGTWELLLRRSPQPR
ncbi:MAG: peptidoglycan-binding protein [Goleter apudmare HA4340-LM2]|jgi:peptidoglycan hydrolase-like protein with peptidoglycan-binding domain|nr:peptidoglycan-binding protein [Goleter apudmare HA4340-LM2]